MLKNLTINADESVIRRARERARLEHVSLNALIRDWLTRYATGQAVESGFSRLMATLKYARPGRRFSREELND